MSEPAPNVAGRSGAQPPPTHARSLGLIYLFGGGAAWFAVPFVPEGFRLDLFIPILVSAAMGAVVCLRFGDRLPAWGFHFLIAYATFAVGAANLIGSTNAAFLPFLAWIVAYAAWFFPLRILVGHLAFATTVVAASTWWGIEPGLRLVRVVPEVATLAILTGVLRFARGQVDVTFERLNEAASVDALTGVLNRRSFERTLSTGLQAAEALGRPLSLILTDIDHFKEVNDRLGHPVGDRCLAAVAQALSGQLRRSDYVFRLGGDEFAVVLAGTGAEEAARVAAELREAVAPATLGVPATITLSFGVATSPHDGRDPTSLYRAADDALYRAKAEGRDRVASTPPPPAPPPVPALDLAPPIAQKTE